VKTAYSIEGNCGRYDSSRARHALGNKLRKRLHRKEVLRESNEVGAIPSHKKSLLQLVRVALRPLRETHREGKLTLRAIR